MRSHCCNAVFACLFTLALPLSAQDASTPPKEMNPGVQILQGNNEGSGMGYALLSINGRLLGAAATPSPPPRLTAQCTRDSAGKLRFELLADFGGIAEIAYFPPWKRVADEPPPPPLQKVQVTMEFLGYTKVKPMKRQWFLLQQLAGEMKYSEPGLGSSNMEPTSYYLQYLRSLPTLRLTAPDRGVVEFETMEWQGKIKAEPLCKASGL